MYAKQNISTHDDAQGFRQGFMPVRPRNYAAAAAALAYGFNKSVNEPLGVNSAIRHWICGKILLLALASFHFALIVKSSKCVSCQKLREESKTPPDL